jgi:zinc transport system permease protein
MITLLIELFQYDFMIKALIVGGFLSLSCAILGFFLVMKRYALIGDGLAHVCFATTSLAVILAASPLVITLPLVTLSAFGIIKLNEKAGLHGDAAIGLMSSLSVAVGVCIASLSKGFNVDIMSTLFGSILVLTQTDVIVAGLLCVIIVGGLLAYYPKLLAISYDSEFSTVSGLPVKRINTIVMMFTAITLAIGIRLVGTMLISSLLIFPAVTALQLSKSFKQSIILACMLALFCAGAGVIGSYILNIPTGACIVLLNGLCFGLCFLIRLIRYRGY